MHEEDHSTFFGGCGASMGHTAAAAAAAATAAVLIPASCSTHFFIVYFCSGEGCARALWIFFGVFWFCYFFYLYLGGGWLVCAAPAQRSCRVTRGPARASAMRAPLLTPAICLLLALTRGSTAACARHAADVVDVGQAPAQLPPVDPARGQAWGAGSGVMYMGTRGRVAAHLMPVRAHKLCIGGR
mgnify:CR=1 FL=1